MSTRLRTPKEAREWFVANGVSVAAWARQNGFKPHTVFDLLRDKSKARRGEAHRAAVALGMKKTPKDARP